MEISAIVTKELKRIALMAGGYMSVMRSSGEQPSKEAEECIVLAWTQISRSTRPDRYMTWVCGCGLCEFDEEDHHKKCKILLGLCDGLLVASLHQIKRDHDLHPIWLGRIWSNGLFETICAMEDISNCKCLVRYNLRKKCQA